MHASASHLLAGLLVILSALVTHAAGKTPASSHPNIIFILADDLGYGDLSCLNPQSRIPTPNLDRLAAQGMVFGDAHSASAVCTPTRYGVLTGRYSWRTRLQSGVLNGYSSPLIDTNRLTVAELLRDAGYHTACIGKWHLGLGFAKKHGASSGSEVRPEEIDFSKRLLESPASHGFDYSFIISASLDMPPYVYFENGQALALPTEQMDELKDQRMIRAGLKSPGFKAENVLPDFTRKAVEYIRSRQTESRPFFLYLPLNSPHTPVEPLPAFKGRSTAGIYGDFVAQTDDSVGQVLRALDEAKLGTNTLLIFTADNGSSPHGFPPAQEKQLSHATSHIYRGRKSDAWEGGHRVPFLVRWPAQVKPGSRRSQTICLNDLMATAAELTGRPLPPNAGEDSFSILPALTGAPSGPVRDYTIHHSINGRFAIRSGPWKLIISRGSGGWTLPEPKAAGLPEIQLYDLEDDPGETRNLQRDRPEVVERLTALLAQCVASGRSTPGLPQTNDVSVRWRK